MESLELTPREIPKGILEDIVLKISGSTLGGSHEKELLKKSPEDFFY